MHIFSLKIIFTGALVALATAFCSAPRAVADSSGSFDLSSFVQPAQETPSNAVGIATASGTTAQAGIAAAAGQTRRPTYQQNYVASQSRPTTNQRLGLATATRTILSQGGSQSLPVTNLDSFVYQSGMNDAIYGDEGTTGIPPYFGMDESHTIGSGINDPGLTTGHASAMPSAWCDYY